MADLQYTRVGFWYVLCFAMCILLRRGDHVSPDLGAKAATHSAFITLAEKRKIISINSLKVSACALGDRLVRC